MPADRRTLASKKLAKLLASDRSRVISSAELRANTAAVVSRVAIGGERIVLTRNGKRVAALVPIEDFESLGKTGKRGRAE